MTTFLSIDYDFFPYIPVYEKIDTPKNGEVSGLFVFDYGHSEGWGGGFADMMWGQRYSNALHYHGLELDEFMQPKLPVARFAYEARNRFDVTETGFADSHRFGYSAVAACAQREGEPVHVVHFDAHHDLGYGESDIKKMRKEGNTDCGAWLYFALEQGHAATVTIVYPDWQGLKEWQFEDEDPFADKPWLEPYRDRITITTWSEWIAANGVRLEREPADVFVCRSSAWVPPWVEDGFWRLLECMDIDGEPFDACERREWDREQAHANAKQHGEMMTRAMGLASDS